MTPCLWSSHAPPDRDRMRRELTPSLKGRPRLLISADKEIEDGEGWV